MGTNAKMMMGMAIDMRMNGMASVPVAENSMIVQVSR
jgi:hypothetical protein